MNFFTRSVPLTDRLLWVGGDVQTKIYDDFINALGSTPDLDLSTYGEPHSHCLDITSILHNAVRQELHDMYHMYRAMGNLGDALTLAEVKNCTLWFRPLYKFLVNIVLKWHEKVYFPWFVTKVEQRGLSNLEKMGKLHGDLFKAMEDARTTMNKHARLSAELSGASRDELIRVQFLDAVLGATNLAHHVCTYMRHLETHTTPLLDKSGLAKADSIDMMRSISKWVMESGTIELDLPLLLRWMPRVRLREWLRQYGVDSKSRPIPFWMYNEWQRDKLESTHIMLVREVLDRVDDV